MQEHDVFDEGSPAQQPGNEGDKTASSESKWPTIDAPKKGGSAWKFASGVFLGLVLFTGIMVAIGTRWENADLSPETPSELEVTRQNLAEQAARIDTSADALLAKKADATVELVGAAAELYLDMLGGVWVPWPSGAPSGYTNPPVATAAPDDVTSDVLTEELTSFSQALLNAVEDVPDENRVEILSAALGSQFLAMNLGGNATPTCGTVDISAAGIALAGAGLVDGSSSSPAAPVSSTHESATPTTAVSSPPVGISTLRALDTARQWLETDAAAMPEESRGTQVARAEKFAVLEEAILRTGAPDTRDAYSPYPELKDGETYTSEALRLATAEILKAATTVNESDRNNLLALVCSFHLTAGERASALPFPGSK